MMDSTKLDVQLFQNEIPMVAAIPMTEAEDEDCVRVYSCSVIPNDSTEIGDRNESQQATRSCGCAPSSTPGRLESTDALPVVGGRVNSSQLTASTAPSTVRSNSAVEDEAAAQEELPRDSSATVIIATPTPQQPTPARTTSPPTAFATPEPPIRHHERSASSPPETTTISVTPPRHSSEPPLTTPNTCGCPSTPVVIQPPQQRTMVREESAPLQMEQLTSPAPSMVVTDESRQQTVILGKWKTPLFACLSPKAWCTSSLPCMSCCCGSIVMGQLMTRLRLNWLARLDHERYNRTFGILVAITFCYFCTVAFGIGGFVYPFFCLVIVLLGMRVRALMRQHYRIPARYCCPKVTCGYPEKIIAWEDFCCLFWCTCCATVQMAQQTHDDKEYPYECFSPTGLPPHASEIVV
ncbi:expressed unknown protein [Seminavis robusta]|uniref:Uncharacterized protein n=1 Tax=Seminavis robusta TaxID=568900 RepID=A0A9N8EH82_9STRA|nr:expressed unknown protein [Seminavis robusta]|eukprot:Sro1128_g244250.1 n/a (408) ;mRNA; f:1580-2904